MIWIFYVCVGVILFLRRKWILPVLVLSLPFERVLAVPVGELFHLKLFFLPLIWAVFRDFDWKLWPGKWEMFFLSLFILSGYLNLFIVEFPLLSFKKHSQYVLLMLILVYGFQKVRLGGRVSFEKMILWIQISAAVVGIIGLFQIVGGVSFKGRLPGTFVSAHNFSNFLLWVLPLFWIDFKSPWKIFALIVLLICFWKTEVRAAFLILGMGAFVYIILSLFQRKKNLGLLLTFVAVVVIFTKEWSWIAPSLEWKGPVIQSRVVPAQKILFRDTSPWRLIFGKGAGSLQESAHSCYFQILEEKGFLGLISFMMILFFAFKTLLRSNLSHDSKKILFLSASGVVFHMGTVTLITLPHIYFLLGMLLGLKEKR